MFWSWVYNPIKLLVSTFNHSKLIGIVISSIIIIIIIITMIIIIIIIIIIFNQQDIIRDTFDTTHNNKLQNI